MRRPVYHVATSLACNCVIVQHEASIVGKLFNLGIAGAEALTG